MNRLLPYLQLIRLPNVFTAWADILMAALVVSALPHGGLTAAGLPLVLLLLLSSSCLYCSGMVWNDYFDIHQDERQRLRPLPSGRVPMRTALLLALSLMAAGVLLAIFADIRSDGFRFHSSLVAVLLAFSIILYDGTLKHTWAGPVAMGACRFFNVLLGLSLVDWSAWQLVLALVVGVYIAGVTWFARTEAEESNRSMLAAAAAVMLLAIFLALTLPVAVPVTTDPETGLPTSPLVQIGQFFYPYLLVGFVVLVGLPVYRAIEHPAPTRVQPAVKQLIFGLVLLDAIVATAFVGPLGLVLLVLLVPANYVGKWVYST